MTSHDSSFNQPSFNNPSFNHPPFQAPTPPTKPTLLKSNSQHLIPGILGGLGPLAHIEFERCILAQSAKRGARQDQDHPTWLLINATATPDRTQSLNGTTSDAAPWLLHYSQCLETMGADFLVVTCNTAHAFHPQIQPQLRIPWIHMMQAVARSIVASNPPVRPQKIGIMATNGTLHTQLYQKSLEAVGLTPIYPEINSEIQQQIMQSIYAAQWGIKASGTTISQQAKQTLHTAMNWFKQQNADTVIAGCTELSVGLACIDSISDPILDPTSNQTSNQTALPWINPLEILADLSLSLAYGEAVLIPPSTQAVLSHSSRQSQPSKLISHSEVKDRQKPTQMRPDAAG